jgi:hypothetical protein
MAVYSRGKGTVMSKNKKIYQEFEPRLHKPKQKRATKFDKHPGKLRHLANVSTEANIEEDDFDDLDYEFFEKIKR